MNFNSIKVQLKHGQVFAISDGISFQFHKGTIKALGGSLLAHGFGYFNSIKVQLKPSFRIFCNIQYRYFNSIKVQLKRLSVSVASSPNFNFNSIKVQLKRPVALHAIAFITDFNSIKVQLKLFERFGGLVA